jgi:hypothetical protein
MFVARASVAQDEKQSPTSNLDPDGVHMRSIRNPPQSTPSFTLAIRAKANEFRIGSNFTIYATIVNITDHTIDHSDWYSDAGEMSYSYDVRDEDGKPVAKIEHKHPELDAPSYYWGAIHAGKSITSNLRVSRVYNFDKPGKYTIQVSHVDPDCLDGNGKPTVVVSNTITITITG